MKKAIVTTTIYSPSESTLKFAALPDWELIVVGDLKTPHESYKDINCRYIHPDEQRDKYPELSEAIGWNCIQRRNIGFVEAWVSGADIVATVDDDNIPLPDWGKKVHVGETVDIKIYEPNSDVFDPLSITNHPEYWHRGYPIQLLSDRTNVKEVGFEKRRILVQADLWNGDPDIDAMTRISHAPELKYENTGLYGSNCIAPFNSQNTFIHREALPYYAVLPHVGRMDDIWGSYILQEKFPNSVAYHSPSVYQARNEQDLIWNLEKEILGYRHTLDFIRNGCNLDLDYVPNKTRDFYEIYRGSF